jgi:DNA-3-methyladenine glycosylase II
MSRLVSTSKLPATRATRKPATRRGVKRPSTKAPLPAIVCDDTLNVAFEALRDADRDLVDRLVAEAGPPPLRLREGDFAGLAWIVVSQQVSTASAKAIHGRLAARFPAFTARALLDADDAALRECGLSAPKMRTIRAIASAIDTGTLDFAALAAMTAEEARATMTAIHGVGPWTADIYLLFCLGHPDAWPAGDLALQEAARMALKLRERPDARKLEGIAERWRPARGVAARLLWSWYAVAKARG